MNDCDIANNYASMFGTGSNMRHDPTEDLSPD